MEEKLFTEINKINDEEELRKINQIVVRKIKQIHNKQAQKILINYNVGDEIEFRDKHNTILRGFIEKINVKSVSVKTEKHGSWRIHPIFITKKIEV